MIKKIDHVVITTSNIEKCLAFYEQWGFISKRDRERYELFASDFKINVHIKGRELSPHAQNVQTGSVDLCFEINSTLDSFKEKLEKKDFQSSLGLLTEQV